jgi:hypothetical protein
MRAHKSPPTHWKLTQRRFYFFFLFYLSPPPSLTLMFSPRLLPSVSRGPYHLGSLWVPRQSLDNYSHARQRNSSAPHSHHAVPTRPIWKSFFVVCSFVCWALGQSNPIPSEVQQHLLLLLFFVLTITNFVGILLPFCFDTSSWPPVKPSSTWYSRPLLSVSPNFKPHNFCLLSFLSHRINVGLSQPSSLSTSRLNPPSYISFWTILRGIISFHFLRKERKRSDSIATALEIIFAHSFLSA